VSYKGKTPHHYDRSSRSFHQGAWKNWPSLHRDGGRVRFPYSLMKRDEEALARRPVRQQFTLDAPRFHFNSRGETNFRKG
jgi:hypothetical protein